eukprot:1380537-Pyramimonas_sp.AAC.1
MRAPCCARDAQRSQCVWPGARGLGHCLPREPRISHCMAELRARPMRRFRCSCKDRCQQYLLRACICRGVRGLVAVMAEARMRALLGNAARGAARPTGCGQGRARAGQRAQCRTASATYFTLRRRQGPSHATRRAGTLFAARPPLVAL